MLGPDLRDGQLPVFEGWRTLEKLGEGGMCAVYRGAARDGGPERALKVLTDKSEASIRRFVDEARLLQRIDHPNVVRVHHIAPDVRPPWLVMDLLGGRDLEETMQLEGPMGPERAARTFADLASGLAAVHAAGVRHRDIKPANIRLGSDGIPRLIDFGIARDASAARQTKAGFVVGTASYLPPEIFTEEDAHGVQDTEQADVYALGQTLCEILAGRPTHGVREDGTEASLLVRIMRDKIDRPHLDPRDGGVPVPEGLAAIVRKATVREAEDRIPTARAFEEALRGWLAERESSASVAPLTRVDPGSLPTFQAPAPPPPPPPTPAPQPPPEPAPPGRSGLATAAVGAAGAMGMAGMGLVVALLVVLALIGGIAIWATRPAANAGPAEIRRVVDASQAQLAQCRPSRGDEVVVRVTVADARAVRVDVVRSNVPPRAEACVERVVGGLSFPTGTNGTAEVPVHFHQP